MKTKDIVVGLGEIGYPILKLISKSSIVVGFDKNENLMNIREFKKYENLENRFIHLCIPFNKNFLKNTLDIYKKFSPKFDAENNTQKSLPKTSLAHGGLTTLIRYGMAFLMNVSANRVQAIHIRPDSFW